MKLPQEKRLKRISSSSTNLVKQKMKKDIKVKNDRAEDMIYTTSPTSIAQLPNETLHHILSFFSNDRKTLLSCCLVSRTFHRLSSPFIWKHLILSPWSTETNEDGEIQDYSETDHGSLNTNTGGKNRKYLLENVKTFTLDYHKLSWCHSDKITSVRLPKLETLHIRFKDFGNFKNFHEKSIGNSKHSNHPCRLLRDIYPSTLILDQVDIRDIDLEINGIPLSIWKNVQHLIFISSSYQWLKPNGQSKLSFPPILNVVDHNIESITWIFDPTEPVVTMGYSSKPSERYPATYLASLLLYFPDVDFTIVDPDLGDRYALPHYKEDAIKSTKQRFTSEAERQKWSGDDIEEMLSYLHFSSLKDWMNEERNWDGKIDKKEVERWKQLVN